MHAGILNFAQVEVYGRPIAECFGARIDQVTCGDSVTAAISRPITNQEELEKRYIEAVLSDVENQHILQQYALFQPAFQKYGDCHRFRKHCPNCTKTERCPLCAVIDAFPHDKLTEAMQKRRSLQELAEALMNIELPKTYEDEGDEGDVDSDEEERKKWRLKYSKSMSAKAERFVQDRVSKLSTFSSSYWKSKKAKKEIGPMRESNRFAAHNM